jgi:hypothetical protein
MRAPTPPHRTGDPAMQRRCTAVRICPRILEVLLQEHKDITSGAFTVG